MKNIRNNAGFDVYDPADVANLTFNPAAGSTKISEVGRHLIPIPKVSGGVIVYTTNIVAATAIGGPGKLLAVYNNNTTVGTVTLGEDATITSLAIGVTDAVGHVGIPCAPNAWTYIACGLSTFAIGSAATIFAFLIDDNTAIKPESK